MHGRTNAWMHEQPKNIMPPAEPRWLRHLKQAEEEIYFTSGNPKPALAQLTVESSSRKESITGDTTLLAGNKPV